MTKHVSSVSCAPAIASSIIRPKWTTDTNPEWWTLFSEHDIFGCILKRQNCPRKVIRVPKKSKYPHTPKKRWRCFECSPRMASTSTTRHGTRLLNGQFNFYRLPSCDSFLLLFIQNSIKTTMTMMMNFDGLLHRHPVHSPESWSFPKVLRNEIGEFWGRPAGTEECEPSTRCIPKLWDCLRPLRLMDFELEFEVRKRKHPNVFLWHYWFAVNVYF